MTDIKDLDSRITYNDGRHLRTARRMRVLAIFLLSAFLFLAFRSESSDRRIKANTERIRHTQEVSCQQGAAYIAKFNALQDSLIILERLDVSREPDQRDARIAARALSRIIPIPTCP